MNTLLARRLNEHAADEENLPTYEYSRPNWGRTVELMSSRQGPDIASKDALRRVRVEINVITS